ncbi:MAG: RsmB/NOP family class I SAM-dependent RNA methyltransferase [Opitutales bacterium]|nr:RsmB/NOP family class I SAM-dependent RNA methyltransferase [Opitutales bacterium]
MDNIAAHLADPGRDEDAAQEPEGGEAHRRALWLTRGVLREFAAIEADLAPFLRRPPPPRIRALLLVAAFEIAQRDPEERAPVVHFAVEAAKQTGARGQTGFVNAVLRRLAALPPQPAMERARRCHPDWLVHRWEKAFGAETTGALLLWNQQPPPVYLHVDKSGGDSPGSATAWPGFRRIEGSRDRRGALKLVDQGRAYFQDPLTLHPGDLLDPLPPDTQVLDLCAAPGGKTWDLLRRSPTTPASVVMIDLAGPRFKRMRANAAAWDDPRVRCAAADAAALTPAQLTAQGLPSAYDAVILDVPCSNTGVLRRRPDAKTRLARAGPATLDSVIALQACLLDRALALLRPGGRLVYSTCSIEAEENRAQIDACLRRHPHTRLLRARESFPWTDGHDGGAAFLLTVRKPPNQSA